MSGTRRRFFQDAAFFGAGFFGLAEALRGDAQVSDPQAARAIEQGRHHSPYGKHKKKEVAPAGPDPFLPMVTPDLADLPHEMDGGVKVFKLVAEPVKRKIAPFKTIDAWGYNGSCPGPTIQVQQGDRVRVIFENKLPESTSIHWHGLEVPIEQDGVPWISQKPIAPGEKYVYEFTVHQEGTFFYHSHGAMQEMMGMIGFFVAHPERSYKPRADHDFGMILQEWAVLPNNSVPNTAAMEFNWLTFNGASAPAITPMIARLGSRVQIAHHQYGDGPPPDSFAWKSIRHDRNGRRPRAGIDVVSDEHRAGGRGASARGGVRCEVSGRVDGALPSAPPHDEQHDGSSKGPRDRNGEHDRRQSAGADGNAGQKRAVRTCASFSDRRECEQCAGIPAGCVHGNGHG